MDKIIVGKAELHMILNALRNDVAERGMINRQEMIELVENSLVDYEDHINDIKSSDLEIVQKAFDKSRLYFVLDKPGVLYGQYVAIENIESLLTWAKQTIGVI